MRVVFHDQSSNGVSCSEDLGKPMGGRVTCLMHVSRLLAEMGFEVEILTPGIREPFYAGGVLWTSRAMGPYEVWVHVRGIPAEFPPVEAKRRILWTRDLPHAGFAPAPDKLKELDEVVYLSHYGQRIWQTYFRQAPAGRVIPNGVDDVFQPMEKEPGLVIHAAHPIRGLKYLPEIWPGLKALHPSWRLIAFSDASLHPGEATDPEYARATDACREAGIDVRAPVPPEEFAGWLGRAQFHLLPNAYPEICSNTVLQSLRCGTPIVTTGGLGATPEWLEHGYNGCLTTTMPHDYMVYRLEVARLAHGLMADPELLKGMQQAETKILSWQEVAEQWASILSA